MHILQTTSFRKTVKKLHKNQKADLDKTVKKIVNTPDIGENKVGDLAGVKVYKFKMDQQLTLLAYTYDKDVITLTLLAFASHESLYKDLKQ
tara:strand:+ start:167 stop:439 length:273 start_codon:yes stop_codon:yes gene_type:complete